MKIEIPRATLLELEDLLDSVSFEYTSGRKLPTKQIARAIRKSAASPRIVSAWKKLKNAQSNTEQGRALLAIGTLTLEIFGASWRIES